MPMAAGPASPTDRVVPAPVATGPTVMPMQNPMMISDSFARDAILAWYRGEFAAANAIIDALCTHLAQIAGGGGSGTVASEYEAVFAAIHRRRLNWIPVLQMQKYHSIADVAVELRRVAATKKKPETINNQDHGDSTLAEGETKKKSEEVEVKVKVAKFDEKDQKVEESEIIDEKVTENDGNAGLELGEEDDSSPDSDITDSGSQEVQPNLENLDICSNHEDCEARPGQIKLTKDDCNWQVNVVKGLKLYEDIFTDSELCKLNDFVNELRAAGQNGELPGNIEPIPALLQGVIDHLLQWQLIPEYKRPNGCIINFFEEGEYSQPFLKPPHLDQPISTLLLSESTMALGRWQMELKKNSLLVMRGNSADMARHVMCPSPNKRISITFFRVRPEPNQCQSPTSPSMNGAMTLWQPGVPSPYAVPNGALNGYEATDMMSRWGVLRAPVVMLAPVRPMVLSPRRLPQGGTGVFLPWTVGSRKPAKHLPPRAQKGRLLALPSPIDTHVAESSSEPGISV
uniref:Fe2OG dioxygenase domain-containing protein n=1 Tax=Fagus sylvatica TaxID=28930 RepID=A0A2N9GW97_FAGSY